MIALPITSLAVAVLAVMLIVLSVSVSMLRVKTGIPVGDGADEKLRRRIRAHGNFTEYVPLSLIALGLVEAHGAPAWMVIAIGAALFAGRLLHAVGMFTMSTPLRGFGMLLNYVALLMAAIQLLRDASL